MPHLTFAEKEEADRSEQDRRIQERFGIAPRIAMDHVRAGHRKACLARVLRDGTKNPDLLLKILSDATRMGGQVESEATEFLNTLFKSQDFPNLQQFVAADFAERS